MKQTYKKYWFGALLPFLCVACSSKEPALEQGKNPTQGEVTLNLKITAASNYGTRSEGHKTQLGNTDENYINLEGNDYRFYVFDGSTGAFLQEFNATVAEAENSEAEFSATFSGTLSSDVESVQVLVLTNVNGFSNGETSAQYPVFEKGQTLSDIYSNGLTSLFTYPSIDGTSWMPDAENGHGIPMFGLSKVIALSELRFDDDPSSIIEIPLLRALAKIEVYADDFEVTDSSNGTDDPEPKVSESTYELVGVSLKPYNANGLFIPNVSANPNWGENLLQVTTPSLASNVTTGQDLKLNLIDKTEKDDDGNDIPRQVYVGYVPEMALSADGASLVFFVKGLGEEDSQEAAVPAPDAEAQAEDDDINKDLIISVSKNLFEFAAGDQGKEDNITTSALLRNHIYQYNLTMDVSGLEVVCTICPWVPYTSDEIKFQ